VLFFFFFQAEDGIRDLVRSRGLGDVYKRQVFDRDIEIARAGARLIDRSVRHVIVEGNYLLLNEAPWNTLAPLFDLTVFLAVPEPVLEARLTERWKALAPDDFRTKMEGNDLPNARLVARNSRPADITIDNG